MSSSVRSIAVIDLGDFSCPRGRQSAAKFAERKLGGQPLIIRMARRLSECALVDEVFIVGSNVPASLLTSGLAGVHSLNMPSVHVCERLCEAADASGAEWVVFVPGNRPFVDITLVDQLLAKAMRTSECDYVGYASDDGDPSRVDRLGLTGEVCHTDTLRRLRGNPEQLPIGDEGPMACWLQATRGAYQLKFIPVPSALDRNDLRFAVEDELDWDDVELLCETVSEEDSQWQELTKIVISNNYLRESMATRNS